jgi:hypothetical protein
MATFEARSASKGLVILACAAGSDPAPIKAGADLRDADVEMASRS